MSDEKSKTPKAPKRGVGTVAIEAIRAGRTNEQALAAVMKEFPKAKTTLSSVNWYRNTLRKDDKTIPTARDLKPKKAAAPAKKADPLD